MNIKISHDASKYLKRLDRNTSTRIVNSIEELPKGDVKRLQGSTKYRLRVGNYRAIFSKNGENILIESVLPRGQVYKQGRLL